MNLKEIELSENLARTIIVFILAVAVALMVKSCNDKEGRALAECVKFHEPASCVVLQQTEKDPKHLYLQCLQNRQHDDCAPLLDVTKTPIEAK